MDGSGLELSSSEAISGSAPGAEGEDEQVADFITVSAGREEGVVDPLSITIADTSHHLPPIGTLQVFFLVLWKMIEFCLVSVID